MTSFLARLRSLAELNLADLANSWPDDATKGLVSYISWERSREGNSAVSVSFVEELISEGDQDGIVVHI